MLLCHIFQSHMEMVGGASAVGKCTWCIYNAHNWVKPYIPYIIVMVLYTLYNCYGTLTHLLTGIGYQYSLLTPCQVTDRPVATAARAQLAPTAVARAEGDNDQGTNGSNTPKSLDGNDPGTAETVAVPHGTPRAPQTPAPKKPKTRQDGLRLCLTWGGFG